MVERVREATGGRGVDVVLDSVGRETQAASMAALAPYGQVVFYGEASGPAAPVEVGDLYGRCLRVSAFRVDLSYGPERWRAARRELLEAVEGGDLRLTISRVLPLEEAAEAHRLLESRAVVGKLILTPT